MTTLKKIYQQHKGKVSDKWSLYLDSYDKILSNYRSQPINILEIGVQNGGSLEIWAKYFPHAQHIIGCDIHPKCGELQYDDQRIQVIIGNAIHDITQQHIAQVSPNFDIIIDDGSHTSSDIIHTFARYFNQLNDGGIFIFEDLHCSYWQRYEGGLYHPHSAIAFFKNLIDIINYEHWGLPAERNEVLRDFYQTYHLQSIIDLDHIHSIEFINSMCVITKRSPIENELGTRLVVGDTAIVETQVIALNGSKSTPIDQSITPNPISPHSKIKLLEEEITALQKHIDHLTQQLSDKTAQLDENIKYFSHKLLLLEQKKPALQDQLQQLTQQHQNLLEQHNKYKKLWTLSLFKPLVQTELAISSANRYRKGFRLLVREKGSIGKAYQYLHRSYQQTHSIKNLKQILKFAGSSQTFIQQTPVPEVFRQNLTKRADEIFSPKVAIIAELSIPQCKKYRVIQKQEMLQAMGIPCSVTSWADFDEAKKQISLASLVIFYRVPGVDTAMALIEECRRLNIKTLWDVDDLIFDAETLQISNTINSFDKIEKEELINGAKLYCKAMLACNEGIASTSGLAKAMRAAGMKNVYVLENSLDEETLVAAQHINDPLKDKTDGLVRIIYGSGTRAHNIDFLEAASALAATLKANPNVIFRIIGYLELPEYFDSVKNQIEHIPFCNYTKYLTYLSECDISIAPLENFIFNDAKSNIKYLEASIAKVASICSPRAAFADVINHGTNGLLADNEQQWFDAFNALIKNTELRKNMAEAAYRSVTSSYDSTTISKQIAEIVNFKPTHNAGKTKILSFNIYYYPQSFGGATVVTEQLNQLLAEHKTLEIYAITTLPPTNSLPPYSVIRYEHKNVTVFGIAVPNSDLTDYNNPRFSTVTKDIIEWVKPDIAHIHCIQGIGVGIVDLCKQNHIKTIVTLHDAWWICPNQFMLDENNRFCEHWDNKEDNRSRIVGGALANIDMLLAPSQYFANLHEKKLKRPVYVNKNGVAQPLTHIVKRKSNMIRFGYVGGMTPIKGVHLILEAFKQLHFPHIELVVVDNMLNLGSQSFCEQDFQGIKNYQIVPAYNQDTIDQFFSEIDVLLFPTQWKESFGLTVREAILRDVWVIATNAGGVTEDIIEGENGTIIPFDSGVVELSNAIVKTYEYYQKMERDSIIDLPKKHIRTFAEQKDELLEMYQTLLADLNPKPNGLLD